MNHDQSHRSQADDKLAHDEPVNYSDVVNVSGELVSKPISPQDAAAINQAAGAVACDDITDIAKTQGVSITETKAGGHSIVTEAVGGKVLGQRVEHDVPKVPTDLGSAAIDGEPITIGEALEAVAISAGDKPVDQSDAAAITAAEIRATGKNEKTPIGLGATAQAAATLNTHAMRREDMTKLSDVLVDATERLEKDKAVTSEDAEAVYAAEVQFPWRRETPETMAEPGGVAASLATAARLNQES